MISAECLSKSEAAPGDPARSFEHPLALISCALIHDSTEAEDLDQETFYSGLESGADPGRSYRPGEPSLSGLRPAKEVSSRAGNPLMAWRAARSMSRLARRRVRILSRSASL